MRKAFAVVDVEVEVVASDDDVFAFYIDVTLPNSDENVTVDQDIGDMSVWTWAFHMNPSIVSGPLHTDHTVRTHLPDLYSLIFN
jgi:hypothetical protein